MPNTVGLLNGVGTLTLRSIGTKVSLQFGLLLLTEPAKFFLQSQLGALFGHATDDNFRRIYELIEQLQEQIEAGFNQISAEIREAALETPHATLATYYTNVDVGMRGENDAAAGAAAVYSAFFADNEVEIINEVGRSTRIIRDIVVGRGAHQSGAYLDVLATRLYNEHGTIQDFQRLLGFIGAMYLTDLMRAALILAVIRDQSESSSVQALADHFLEEIGEYDGDISGHLAGLMRSIPTIEPALTRESFHIVNKATNKHLGRYFQLVSSGGRTPIHTHWQMIEHGEFVYLYAPGAKRGLDHYYGRSIQPIGLPDSVHHNHLWKFVRLEEEPRWWRIQNRATGRVLDHYYGRDIAAANLDAHPNHLWEVVPSPTGEHYQIVNRATGALLGIQGHDVNAFRARETIDAGIYNEDLQFDGLWDALSWTWGEVEGAATDYFNLVNAVTGKAVDFYYGKSFSYVPAPSGHPNHLWRVLPTREDEEVMYSYIRNLATNRTFDHYYGRSIAGATDLNPDAPNDNHIWRLDVLDGVVA